MTPNDKAAGDACDIPAAPEQTKRAPILSPIEPNAKEYEDAKTRLADHDQKLSRARVIGRPGCTYVVGNWMGSRNLACWHDVLGVLAAFDEHQRVKQSFPWMPAQSAESSISVKPGKRHIAPTSNGLNLGKRIATMQARCALAGVTLEVSADDLDRRNFVVSVGALTRMFASLNTVGVWLDQYLLEGEVPHE